MAGIIASFLLSAVVAPIHVPSENGSPTGLDITHDLKLLAREPMNISVLFSEAAEHIGNRGLGGMCFLPLRIPAMMFHCGLSELLSFFLS
jgi:hypothetical protein